MIPCDRPPPLRIALITLTLPHFPLRGCPRRPAWSIKVAPVRIPARAPSGSAKSTRWAPPWRARWPACGIAGAHRSHYLFRVWLALICFTVCSNFSLEPFVIPVLYPCHALGILLTLHISSSNPGALPFSQARTVDAAAPTARPSPLPPQRCDCQRALRSCLTGGLRWRARIPRQRHATGLPPRIALFALPHHPSPSIYPMCTQLRVHTTMCALRAHACYA